MRCEPECGARGSWIRNRAKTSGETEGEAQQVRQAHSGWNRYSAFDSYKPLPDKDKRPISLAIYGLARCALALAMMAASMAFLSTAGGATGLALLAMGSGSCACAVVRTGALALRPVRCRCAL